MRNPFNIEPECMALIVFILMDRQVLPFNMHCSKLSLMLSDSLSQPSDATKRADAEPAKAILLPKTKGKVMAQLLSVAVIIR